MSTNEQAKVIPSQLEVLPIAGRIGAEIKGVSLAPIMSLSLIPLMAGGPILGIPM